MINVLYSKEQDIGKLQRQRAKELPCNVIRDILHK